ncbi:MAG: cation:proton antiporter [Gemmatimonadetes bacterium]|nr:cation:proton antiporter [Gemmatimonadota bacterium]
MTVLGLVLLFAGACFVLIGSIGVIRLPDFYTRAHAASKPDTLGLVLSMAGLAIIQGGDLSSIKLLLIVAFVAIANPAATHALGRSAVRSGLEPWTVGQGAKR